MPGYFPSRPKIIKEKSTRMHLLGFSPGLVGDTRFYITGPEEAILHWSGKI